MLSIFREIVEIDSFLYLHTYLFTFIYTLVLHRLV